MTLKEGFRKGQSNNLYYKNIPPEKFQWNTNLIGNIEY